MPEYPHPEMAWAHAAAKGWAMREHEMIAIGSLAVEQSRQLATEPDRIRAAVVKALNWAGDQIVGPGAQPLYDRADAIEDGADFE